MSVSPELRIAECIPGVHDGLLYPIIRELRTELDQATFEARWLYQSQFFQYRLIAAWIGEQVTAVMGLRPVATLSRGRFLHIDDLVVHPQFRRKGIGRALLHWAEADARQAGIGSVYLDSRADALEFYRQLGYIAHGSVLVRKVLKPAGLDSDA
ncbi:MAG: GNAT family N-acetyltransferase [Gammaproteobacteria bacterium]